MTPTGASGVTRRRRPPGPGWDGMVTVSLTRSTGTVCLELSAGRDPETVLVSPTTTRIPGRIIRTGTEGLRLLGLLLTVRAQSVRSHGASHGHAVTSSPFCDSAHMDAYAYGFPI